MAAIVLVVALGQNYGKVFFWLWMKYSVVMASCKWSVSLVWAEELKEFVYKTQRT